MVWNALALALFCLGVLAQLLFAFRTARGTLACAALGVLAVTLVALHDRDATLLMGQAMVVPLLWARYSSTCAARKRTSFSPAATPPCYTPPGKTGLILRSASLLLVALLVGGLLHTFDLRDASSEAWMDAHVRDRGWSGVMAYVGLVTLLTGLGVPRQFCSTLGGYAFGMWLGTLWATVGTGIACCLCFGYARFLGQEWLHRRHGDRLVAFNAFLGSSTFLLTLLVRIVPLGSNFLTNILAGISHIPALPFLGGSVVGFTVQNAIFALLGSGLRAGAGWLTWASVVLYALSLTLGLVMYRRFKIVRTEA